MPLPSARAERPTSLRDYAYRELRDAIVSGQLAPGERLRDPELEAWLGVSRTPIREAIARLETAGLVHTRRAKQTVVAPLDTRTHAEIRQWLDALAPSEQQQLVQAMTSIERLLDAKESRPAPYLLRPPRSGDIGWVIARHGALYAHEYHWDMRFEALVGHIAARFVERLDPRREACWIAERDHANVGCVFLVQARDEATDAPLDGVAQLRLLLVEPSARGLGIGARLVDEAIAFARSAGYRRMMLWTNAGLDAARALYDARGFRLTAEERHHSFGHDLVGQTLERELS